jgi:hypothetical protein
LAITALLVVLWYSGEGDLRQILPMVKEVNREDIMYAWIPMAACAYLQFDSKHMAWAESRGTGLIDAIYPGISEPKLTLPAYCRERIILTTYNDTITTYNDTMDEPNHSILAKSPWGGPYLCRL